MIYFWAAVFAAAIVSFGMSIRILYVAFDCEGNLRRMETWMQSEVRELHRLLDLLDEARASKSKKT